MKAFNVALDGPSGAGKSSIADVIASRYGLTHLDTGAMYRAIALTLHEMDIPAESGNTLDQALAGIDLQIKDGRVIVNGRDVSEEIRKPYVSALASQYSALPAVRRKLVVLQQHIAADKGYILDGRDICDVVLPDAEVKLYLDAAPEARAQRRLLQDQAKGIDVSYEDVLKAILERDQTDSNRKTDPLRISDAAVGVDSSNLTFDQTVEAVYKIINQTLLKEA